MAELAQRWQGLAPIFLSLMRIVVSAALLTTGTTKLFGFPAAAPHAIEPMSQIWIGGALEVVCGALLLIGLFTRINAFLMSGMMAVAYFQFHMFGNPETGPVFWPTINGGSAAIAFCFIYLYISTAGGGPWSVDAALRKKT